MNQVVLIGRVVRDLELRYMTNGTAVVKMTLAINKDLSKDKEAEFKSQGKPTADFVNVVVWGKMAEACANYLAKGRLVAVNGRINTGSYTKDDGSKVYTTDVMASKVEFLEWGEKKEKKEEEDDVFMPISDDDIPF
jgi:single-strand DNA-binding protein